MSTCPHCKTNPRISATRPYCTACDHAYEVRRGQKLRLRCLKAYSNGKPECACCGTTVLPFLCLDHIGGGGLAHVKAIGGGGSIMYRWLIRHGYPPGIRVLCHNCNMAIGFYGRCPHEELRTLDILLQEIPRLAHTTST